MASPGGGGAAGGDGGGGAGGEAPALPLNPIVAALHRPRISFAKVQVSKLCKAQGQLEGGGRAGPGQEQQQQQR